MRLRSAVATLDPTCPTSQVGTLPTKPADFCKRDGCALPGTNVATATWLTAVCQTVGRTTTNGNDTTPIDSHNPGRSTSDRWYGIRLKDDRFGYLSEVWVAPEHRGGLALPQC